VLLDACLFTICRSVCLKAGEKRPEDKGPGARQTDSSCVNVVRPSQLRIWFLNCDASDGKITATNIAHAAQGSEYTCCIRDSVHCGRDRVIFTFAARESAQTCTERKVTKYEHPSCHDAVQRLYVQEASYECQKSYVGCQLALP